MSADEVCSLDAPHKNDYDEKTWAAITYARAWARSQGDIKDQNVISEFEKHFDKKKRAQILSTILVMNFSNRLVNTFKPPLDREKAFDALKNKN